MSQPISLQAIKRDTAGTADSRRARLAGHVPAIMYGKTIDNVALLLEQKELFKALDNEQIYTSRLNLQVDKDTYSVLLKDVQRHPYKKQLMHVDFLQVTDKTVVTVHVPIHFINESTCVGVKTQGGIINHQMIEVEIKCTVGNIPDSIEVDMQERTVGDTIHLSDLSLPKGVSIPMLALGEDHDLPVARVTGTQKTEEEAEETAETE